MFSRLKRLTTALGLVVGLGLTTVILHAQISRVANSNADLAGNHLLTAENSYTITGLHTFSRGSNPPFAVNSGSAKIDNLNADTLDGISSEAFPNLASNNTWTGTQTFSSDVTFNGLLTSDLTFTDGTYDIGKSGATRPRDIFTTRNVSVGSLLLVNGFGTHAFSSGGTGYNTINIRNTTAGVANGSLLQLGNDVTGNLGALFGFSSTFTSSGPYVANGITLEATGAGGYTAAATNASGDVRFYSRNALALTLGASQLATFTGNVTAPVGLFTNTGRNLRMGPESGTAANYGTAYNGTAHLLWGVDSAAGDALFGGTEAYAGVIGMQSNNAFELASNNRTRMKIHASGGVSIGEGVADPGYQNFVANGIISANGFGTHTFSGNGAGANAISIRNINAGTANRGAINIGNDSSATSLILRANSSTLTPTGAELASGGSITATEVGGLSLVTNFATSDMRFYNRGGTLALTLGASQAATFTGTVSSTASGTHLFGGGFAGDTAVVANNSSSNASARAALIAQADVAASVIYTYSSTGALPNGTLFLANGSGGMLLETTHASGAISLATNSLSRWIVDTDGTFIPNITNTLDFGTKSRSTRYLYANSLATGSSLSSQTTPIRTAGGGLNTWSNITSISAAQAVGWWSILGDSAGGCATASNPGAGDYVMWYACMESDTGRDYASGDTLLIAWNPVLKVNASHDTGISGGEIDIQNAFASDGDNPPRAFAAKSKVGLSAVCAAAGNDCSSGFAVTSVDTTTTHHSGTVTGGYRFSYAFDANGARFASFYSRLTGNSGSPSPLYDFFSDTSSTTLIKDTGTHTHLLDALLVEINPDSFILRERAAGTGNIVGPRVEIGRNNSGSGAAGTLLMYDRSGVAHYIWVGADNKVYIATTAPQEDGSPSDTGGTVVGTQS